MLLPVYAAIVITFARSPGVPPSLVDRMFAEAQAIWEPCGVTLETNAGAAATGRSLTVAVGPFAKQLPRESAQPIAWILLSPALSVPRIYVSSSNALDLLRASSSVVGTRTLPPEFKEMYLGRAMGRALAHELGHYLLASTEHTPNGLMKIPFSAFELFGRNRASFSMTAQQLAVIRSRSQIASLP